MRKAWMRGGTASRSGASGAARTSAGSRPTRRPLERWPRGRTRTPSYSTPRCAAANSGRLVLCCQIRSSLSLLPNQDAFTSTAKSGRGPSLLQRLSMWPNQADVHGVKLARWPHGWTGTQSYTSPRCAAKSGRLPSADLADLAVAQVGRVSGVPQRNRNK